MFGAPMRLLAFVTEALTAIVRLFTDVVQMLWDILQCSHILAISVLQCGVKSAWVLRVAVKDQEIFVILYAPVTYLLFCFPRFLKRLSNSENA